jgi:hypothetical protein
MPTADCKEKAETKQEVECPQLMCLLGLTPFEYSAFLFADRPDFHPLLETDKNRVHSVVLSLIEPSHK